MPPGSSPFACEPRLFSLFSFFQVLRINCTNHVLQIFKLGRLNQVAVGAQLRRAFHVFGLLRGGENQDGGLLEDWFVRGST